MVTKSSKSKKDRHYNGQKKDRHYNGQKKKGETTTNNLQSTLKNQWLSNTKLTKIRGWTHVLWYSYDNGVLK